MYICICKAVTERRMQEAVDEGLQSMRELRLNLGVTSCCGKCGACAKEVLKKCLQNSK